MQFVWDEAKRKSNLNKHGMDFADAKIVFAGAIYTFEDDRFDYDEQRFITLGLLNGEVIVLAHTEQENVVRVISMRKATNYEQRLYFRSFTD